MCFVKKRKKGNKEMKRYLISGVMLLLGSLIYLRADAESSTYGDWQVREAPQNAGVYITSLPQSEIGTFTKRGQAYISVTARPSQKDQRVFSVKAGYTYKEGSIIKASIFDAKNKSMKDLELFSAGENAWASNDEEIIRFMKKGKTLIIEGTSSKGTVSTDTYSLEGFSKALEALNKLSESQK